MKRHNNKLLIGLSLSFFMSIGIGITLSSRQQVETFATYDVTTPEVYYANIGSGLSGSQLLNALNSLNSTNRKSTVGYDGAKTYFSYTDYDPAYASIDSNGQPMGAKLLSFYSGNSREYSNGMNREHVWPDSRGGNSIDGDIHMPRPTIQSENGSRGNSFYVEGMKHSQNGWDPAMESFGDETYRGDSARIIFYCAIANKSLTLIDATNDSASNKTMGKLSDLLKWNLEYPVQQREQNRNNGAQYLQGNRNPFIDHPEYACKIWGDYNDDTKKVCATTAPTSISLNIDNLALTVDDTFKLEVASVVPSDAHMGVNYSSDNTAIATVGSDGLVTAKAKGNTTITATSVLDSNVKSIVNVTVNDPVDTALESISLSLNSTTISVGEKAKLNIGLNPTNTFPKPTYVFTSSDSSVASVSSSGEILGLSEGGTTIEVTATQSKMSITKKSSIYVNVVQSSDYKKITTSEELVDGKYIIVCDSVSKIVNPNASPIDSASNAMGVVISDSKVSSTQDVEACSFDVTKVSNGYKFVTGSGKFLTKEGEKALGLSNTEVVLSVNVGSETTISSGAKSIKYNTSWGGFRFYGSGQAAVFLYKKSIGSAPVGPVSVNGVTISQSSATLCEGKELTLTATVSPSNATNKNVSWSSSDFSVASVSNGLVSAIKEGNATITVTTEDGSFSATCEVIVTKGIEVIHVTGVSLNKTSLSLNVNEEYTLVATVAPSDATNKSVTWSSSDSSVVSINNGKIKALKAGAATITVTTVDGSFTATCRVEVKESVQPSPSNNSNNLGIIIGSVAGGTVALGGVIALIVFLVIKNKSRKLIK